MAVTGHFGGVAGIDARSLAADEPRSLSARHASEDWWSLAIGLVIFVLSLGTIGGLDLLGWGVTTSVWVDLSKAVSPVSKHYAAVGPIGSLLATYLFLLVLLSIGARSMRLDLRRFAAGFTVIFTIRYLAWVDLILSFVFFSGLVPPQA
jgi:hypothetical protein